MAPFGGFVQFLTTGGVGYLLLDWATTLAFLVTWYQLRPMFVNNGEVR